MSFGRLNTKQLHPRLGICSHQYSFVLVQSVEKKGEKIRNFFQAIVHAILKFSMRQEQGTRLKIEVHNSLLTADISTFRVVTVKYSP